ncbi:MAG: P-II family nitrogen regulator [Clostridiales bacterium]|nr:P-II family nitrogen regulator [Clostridiales bacterium]
MTDYELIVCIVNAGFSETVMAAAKEQGARGGTVIHARGTAAKEAEEIFHITVQPDKEIVLIVVPNNIRDAVLHAVYQQAGLKTAGQGISFSMPVTNTVGLSSAPVVPAQTEKEKTKDDKEEKAKDGSEKTKHNEKEKAKPAAEDSPPPAEKTSEETVN